MRIFKLSGVINRSEIDEPSARMLYKLFKEDGKEITMTYVRTEHDRPLYRKPTEEEIMDGIYHSNEYVLTTAEDGII